MTTCFDAVLDDRKKPLYNGTPEEVLMWLESQPSIQNEVMVCIGRTMRFVTVEEYLQEFG